MENKLYIVYDADGVHEPPVYGVFTSLEDAIKGCDWLVEQFVKECLETDPKESGIDPEYDLDWLRKDCRNSLAIQTLSSGINKIELLSDIESPYLED
jgi:hypothetical protein